MGRRTALHQQEDHELRASRDAVADLRARARAAIAKGQWAKAEAVFNRVVAMGVVDANVYNDLATLYDRKGIKEKEAFELLCRAHGLAPEDPNIKKNLLSALTRTIGALAAERRFREALPLLQQKVAMEPQSALAQRELGYCHAQLGELQTAIQYFTRAINLDPNEATYYNDLGLACFELRMLTEAQGAFQQVLKLRPDSVVAYVHLGLLANLTGLSAIAVNMLRRAIAIDPTCGAAHSNLGLYLRDQGMQEECRKHYVEAVRLKPDSLGILSSYLLTLNDDPHTDPGWVAAEHRRFQAAVKGGIRPIVARNLEPARRLRIAYLSPDLRNHSVAYFMLPLLEAHDRSKVEVTCYSTSNVVDETTERIRAACDRWRSVFRASDEELAETIGRDEIDILVELSGHTAENRLPMLARRVAPIQITYLGYPNTTGLAEMDYRITDAIADPSGASDAWHTERLIRVEGGFLVFRPLEWGGDTTPSEGAAQEGRAVTFGSFNNLAKINAMVLDAWASILEGVPGSALFLKAMGLRDERVQERIRAVFRARGVDAEARVTMVGHERSNAEHLRLYHRVDLALDTFPYNGTTTTCEALWMGTPVVTYEGRSHAGRVGGSLLTHVGLGELVAKDLQGYINKAVSLGRDWEALVRLRSGLRERFATSPVMDANRLARGLETAYRNAWHRFCAGSR
jgi:predicted O-linked N-acetylglucosamine transferase (SPINDLY family)